MSVRTLSLQVAVFAVALWLGLYLLARNPTKPRLRWTGLGLLAYALALALELLDGASDTPGTQEAWHHLTRLLILLPAVLWTGALVHFLPEELALQRRLSRLWATVWFPGVLLAYAASVLSGDWAVRGIDRGALYPLFAAFVILPLLGGPLLLVRTNRPFHNRTAVGVLVIATIFFGLQVGWFLFPFIPVPRVLLLLGIGLDLFLLGIVIAVVDAFEEGEAIRRDMLRSLAASFLLAMLFGGQVALFIVLADELTLPLLVLLLSTVTVAIGFETFSESIYAMLDIVAFGRNQPLVAERASLRAAAREAPRLQEQLHIQDLDDEQLVRLTRRALSRFGDLPRLSASPLTRLVLIDSRLAARGAKGDTLERAAELKALLAESIERLRPRGEGYFGTSDEWRYYNALYFPYVVGLKPYSQRATHDHLDPVAKKALDWFRQTVPERTMYNWQSAAAELVARDLKEKATRAANLAEKDPTGSQWQ